MNPQQIVGTFEFRSYGNDKPVDVQIDEWLQQYPQVIIVDVKYNVVPYVDGDTLHFATFALVLFHEPDAEGGLNKAATQQMQMPASAMMRARREYDKMMKDDE